MAAVMSSLAVDVCATQKRTTRRREVTETLQRFIELNPERVFVTGEEEEKAKLVESSPP